MVLRNLFGCFNETFSMEMFVFGAKYVRRKHYDCQLLNFIWGQAKLAVYTSRKNKIEQKSGHDVVV